MLTYSPTRTDHATEGIVYETEPQSKIKTNPWKIDLAVAVNFFCRPDTFAQVFDQIRKARPRQLFLIADGPRPGNQSDIENCRKCKKIAENIDWQCEVYKLYNDVNKGLFLTYFDSMAKVFEVVDYCVFMEDDVVPAQSFFPYCKYLLEKYKDDLRISFVSAINQMPDGISGNVESDYFFNGEGALYAYGLWKRTFEAMNMAFLKSPYAIHASIELAKVLKKGYERRIKKYKRDLMWQGHIPHVEIYRNLFRLLYWQMCIVPKYNLVKNIGLSGDASAHTADDIRKIPKAKRGIYTTPTYELTFPLKDPEYVICDLDYEKRVNYITAWNKPLLATLRRIEAIFRHICTGDFSRVTDKFKKVISGKYQFDE